MDVKFNQNEKGWKDFDSLKLNAKILHQANIYTMDMIRYGPQPMLLFCLSAKNFKIIHYLEWVKKPTFEEKNILENLQAIAPIWDVLPSTF